MTNKGKKNLFIVNTPLQLLTAYIVANAYQQEAANYLFLLNPKGYKTWAESKCLGYMSADNGTWQDICLFTSVQARMEYKENGPWRFLQSFKAMVRRNGPMDRVFLGNDKSIVSQLVVEIAGCTSYLRFDEGIGSYMLQPRRRRSQAAEWLTVKAVRLLAGLRSNMQYNIGSIGQGKAAEGDYLYKPQLLSRYSPQVRKIERQAVWHVMEKLMRQLPDLDAVNLDRGLLFLASPLVERNMMTMEVELAYLEELEAMVRKAGLKMAYKTHHGESPDKINHYRARLQGVEFFCSAEPIEALYYSHDDIRFVVSYMSSGMIYTDVFARHKVTPISTYKLWKTGARANSAVYKQIESVMRQGGVAMPETAQELTDLISGNV